MASAEITIGQIWHLLGAWQAETARALDQMYAQGRLVGLSREEVDEVIHAWNRYYQQTPWPLDWDQVGKAITRRSLGLQWDPPTGRGNW